MSEELAKKERVLQRNKSRGSIGSPTRSDKEGGEASAKEVQMGSTYNSHLDNSIKFTESEQDAYTETDENDNDYVDLTKSIKNR